tara:strand:+ start:75 stop:590 length:516 start_codon:yes stop_codon:yes gene_type:complete
MNPVNKLFKEVKKLEDSLKSINSNHPFSSNGEKQIWTKFYHDCEPKDCFKRDDGLWETPPEVYNGNKVRKFVFIWRYHPNYCYRGRPHYTHTEQLEFIDKSETEKVLHTYEGYELGWAWDEISGPTNIVWGMSPTGWHYFLRKDGEILVSTPVKKHFKEYVEEELEERGFL